jgi:hypothetical protein
MLVGLDIVWLKYLRSVKRSQALRGRNLTRDSRADGAPMVHQASDGQSRQRLLSFTIGHRSDASENPGAWGRAPSNAFNVF